MTLPHIRELRAADVTAVAELAAVALPDAWSEKSINEMLALHTTWGLVMVAEEGIVGIVLLQTVLDQTEVLFIMISPTRQREGLGRCLFARVMKSSHVKQSSAVFLEVAVDNQPAITFYLKQGFVEVSRRKNYYSRNGSTIDCICMKLSL